MLKLSIQALYIDTTLRVLMMSMSTAMKSEEGWRQSRVFPSPEHDRDHPSGSVQVWFGRVQPDRAGLVIRHADATCYRDPSPYPHHSPSPTRQSMAKGYRRLWKDVTSTNNEGKAVRTLADILLDKEGRTFISNLAREDANLCIEILDLVSPDPHLLPSPVSDGSIRVSQSTTSEPQRNRLSSSR